ncbi:insecticidal delta-endotoxin Cry8Ea1 family protein [Dyella sp.]|uniref:insecticidal delta-endotoxin Cry8Ea1 family protein n=1 Tax=Dyella sp. TaxID=1869338 RepID=UPI002ED004F2
MSSTFSKHHPLYADSSRRLFLKRTGLGSACALASPWLAGGIIAPAWATADQTGRGLVDPNLSEEDMFFNLMREGTLKVLDLIPYVGGILSGIGSLIVPRHGETIAQRWQKIIDSINSVVDTKITEAIRSLIAAELEGLSDLAHKYILFTDSQATQDLRTLSIAQEDHFAATMPKFRIKGYEKPLINMYVIAANMHLALLRDMVVKGKELGLQDKSIKIYQDILSECIQTYGKHVDDTIKSILSDVADRNPEAAFVYNEPLASVLKAKAQYQLTSLDIRAIWPYMDTKKYPGKVQALLQREIFSPLCGSYFDKKIPVPRELENFPVPRGTLASMQVRNYQYIDGITSYFIGGHPSEDYEENIGGDGGRKESYFTGEDTTGVICEYNNAVAALTFVRKDGSKSSRFGDVLGGRHLTVEHFGYPGHRLSSVHGFGTAKGYGNVLSGCVFGFQLINQSARSLSPGLVRKFTESAPRRLLPMLLE